MTYQLANAKVWDGSQWVQAVGGSSVVPKPIDRPAGVTVQADVTTHTKGAWTEVIASTTAEANLLWVRVYNVVSSNTATGMLLDIGIGAAGSETVIAENIAVGSSSLSNPETVFPVPVNVPSGSRIAVRNQAVISSDTAVVIIRTFTGDPAPASVTVFGTSTATSRGSAAGASGAWAQIIASTSVAYRNFVLIPSMSTNASGINTRIVSLGFGAAGSETSVGSVQATATSGEACGLSVGEPATAQYMVGAAAGTRVSLSSDGSIASIDWTLIGVPYP